MSQREAYKVYQKALRDGVLVRPNYCGNCGRKCVVDGHHADYDLPLVVQWLCRDCHQKWHAQSRIHVPGRVRPRCLACGRLIYLHLIDSGYAVEVEGGSVHKGACARTHQRIASARAQEARENVA